jgi:hypothetical protein
MTTSTSSVALITSRGLPQAVNQQGHPFATRIGAFRPLKAKGAHLRHGGTPYRCPRGLLLPTSAVWQHVGKGEHPPLLGKYGAHGAYSSARPLFVCDGPHKSGWDSNACFILVRCNTTSLCWERLRGIHSPASLCMSNSSGCDNGTVQFCLHSSSGPCSAVHGV